MTHRFGLLLSIVCSILLASPVEAQPRKTITPAATQHKPGEELIKAYQCVSCHIINGGGAQGGVSLDNLKRSKQFIVEHLLDPEEHVEKNAAAFNFDPNLMPSHQLTATEARAMADYLLQKNPKTKQSKPPSKLEKKTKPTAAKKKKKQW